ncbi:MAG: ribulose-phosphate 3-epimerase [Candidatus Latescibacteria bacterium]|nr:ribulose-phosphate 3-epimerase [Candidatus Latescibacterota bacterium]
MLKCSTSLWSADLGELAAEIRRVEPFSERFHLDVADGHYTPNLLFFPDLVKTLRPHTQKPFEVHLMTTDPLAWIAPFAEAGADVFIFCFDAVPDPGAVLKAIKASGKEAGVSLLLTEDLDLLEPHWQNLDVLTIVGTAMGIKGAPMDAGVPDKIRRARRLIDQQGLSTLIQADGGIRRETVPLLAAAGADYIVPGSLMFKEEPAAMRQWLATLRRDP